jgi:heterodisulfide reductase subunit B
MKELKYAYYPGCSLESTARMYDLSVREVCAHLGIALTELFDWNCCGASSGHNTDRRLARALAGRNLAIAEKTGMDVAVACPACYLQLRTAHREMNDDEAKREELAQLLDMPYAAKSDVRHLLDIIYHDIGPEELKKKVQKPLKGLKLACYYGCYLVRPPAVVGFDDPENPTTMDSLLEAMGAGVKDWCGKVDCCGGGLSLSKRKVATRLVSELADMARSAGVEALVTACPLCHSNLEMRQSNEKESKLPIFYFTELMGLAMGIAEARSWLRKHLISPLRLLARYGL